MLEIIKEIIYRVYCTNCLTKHVQPVKMIVEIDDIWICVLWNIADSRPSLFQTILVIRADYIVP